MGGTPKIIPASLIGVDLPDVPQGHLGHGTVGWLILETCENGAGEHCHDHDDDDDDDDV